MLTYKTLVTNLCPAVEQCSKEQLPKHSVKFILHATGNIAAKFPYNQVKMLICIASLSHIYTLILGFYLVVGVS